MVIVLSKFFSEQQVDKIADSLKDRVRTSKIGGNTYDPNIRSSSSIMFRRSEMNRYGHEDFCKQLKLLIDQMNDIFYHYQLTSESYQFVTYQQGDMYKWHKDTDVGIRPQIRKISASIQLSDPRQYKGGELRIEGCDSVCKQKGSIIMFPSDTMHQVDRVTEGIRHSLVFWYEGPYFC